MNNSVKQRDNVLNSKIAIIGLGYVGLPLAIEFAKRYIVLGFDANTGCVEELSQGKDRALEADFPTMKLGAYRILKWPKIPDFTFLQILKNSVTAMCLLLRPRPLISLKHRI